MVFKSCGGWGKLRMYDLDITIIKMVCFYREIGVIYYGCN